MSISELTSEGKLDNTADHFSFSDLHARTVDGDHRKCHA